MSKIYFKKAIVIFISVIMLIGIFPNFSVSAEDVSNLQPVDSTYAFIKSLEGYSSQCFWDVAQWTIGYGNKCPYTHTSNGVRGQKGGHTISEAQARELFSSKLSGYVSTLKSNCKGLSMTQNQFDALLSATYNHGNVNNCPLKYYLQGKLTESEAREQYYEWCINAGTADEKGLRNRRKKEADLFFSNPNPNPPTWAKVSLDRVSYRVGEEVKFKLESDTGNSYTVGIDDANENRLYTKGTDVNLNSTTQYYTHIFDTPGQYSCFITTYNDMGHIDSKRIYFSIYDTKPGWAKVDINSKEHGGNVYKVGQNINFNLSSDTGFSYTVGIDIENDDGTRKRIDTKEVSIHESPIYTRSFDTAGNYSCYITTYNDYGLADSERIFFTVYDHKPDWAKVIINSDTKNGLVYDVGEDIYFNLTSNTGFCYTVGIDSENGERKRIDTQQIGIDDLHTYTRSFSEPGKYSCYITTYNDYGLTDSERIFFTISPKGDCNADGEFNISDAVLLQKWLLAVPDVQIANWKAADLCEDGRLDVFDLCLMKRMLVKNS